MPSNLKRGPGVYGSETDRAIRVESIGINNGAVAGNFERGPLGWTKVSGGPKAIVGLFGKPNDRRWLYAGYCAILASKKLASVWINRLQGNSNFPLLLVSSDAPTNATVTGITAPTPVADPTTVTFTANDKFLVYPIGPGKWSVTDGVGITLDSTVADLTSGQFKLYVWLGTSTNIVETFTVSRSSALDGFGKQTFIEDVVNNKSAYIRVINNDMNTTGVTASSVNGNFVTGAGPLEVLDATNASITQAHILAAFEELKNSDKYDAQILINAGYDTQTIHEKLIEVASTRVDGFAICDKFVDVANADLAVAAYLSHANLLLGSGNDRTFGELVGPYFEIYDQYNDRNVLIPASAGIAYAMGNTLNATGRVHQPAAGEVFARVNDAIKLQYEFNKTNQADLYSGNVNFIVNLKGAGPTVYSQRTLYRPASPFRLKHVRRLISQIRVDVETFLRPACFQLNTTDLREGLDITVSKYMDGVQDAEGVYFFEVICDDSNNPPSVIDAGELVLDLYIQPTIDAEIINFNITATPTGVNIQELISGKQ